MLTMAAVRTMRVWSLAICAAGLCVVPGWAQSTSVCFPAGDTCQPQATAVLQQVVVNYAPQTVYRTQWTQVPLTLYRPLTTTDPVTGCTVTCIRPCTTYQLQARRVPHTTLRPVYSTIAVNTAPLPSYHAAPATSYVQPARPGFGVPEAGCGVSLQGAVPYDESPAGQPSRPAALPALPADLPPVLQPRSAPAAPPASAAPAAPIPHGVRLVPVPPEEASPAREPAAVPVASPPLQPIPDPDELDLQPAHGQPSSSGRDKLAWRTHAPALDDTGWSGLRAE